MKEIRVTAETTDLSRLLKVINLSECDKLPMRGADCELDGKREEVDDVDLFTQSITTDISPLLTSLPIYVTRINSPLSVCSRVNSYTYTVVRVNSYSYGEW